MSRLSLLRSLPWSLRANGRAVVCSLCDRGAILEWQGAWLCRWHWLIADRHRMARAFDRERERYGNAKESA